MRFILRDFGLYLTLSILMIHMTIIMRRVHHERPDDISVEIRKQWIDSEKQINEAYAIIDTTTSIEVLNVLITDLKKSLKIHNDLKAKWKLYLDESN